MITLGLPRDMLSTIGLKARINLVQYVTRTYPTIPIHLLGTNIAWPSEVAHPILRQHARSVDTSLVFTLTAEQIQIGSVGQKEFTLSRPTDYFELPASRFRPELLKENLKTFDSWTQAG